MPHKYIPPYLLPISDTPPIPPGTNWPFGNLRVYVLFSYTVKRKDNPFPVAAEVALIDWHMQPQIITKIFHKECDLSNIGKAF